MPLSWFWFAPRWTGPEGQTAPYQILLDDAEVKGERNAIWAPTDTDDLIRAGFRFRLRDAAECRVDRDEYAKCTVVGLLYREPAWPEGRYAPYQVQVEGLLPGSLAGDKVKEVAEKKMLIWLPDDSDEYIREPSQEREERLVALEGLRASGVLNADEYAERRREIVHS